jgi:threonine aldolase
MPRSKVIEVENTHNAAGGSIIPLENIKSLRSLADKYNLAMHLDGARIWNASVETGISVSEYASSFESVSCCLSKGLGAPIGSLIAGTREFIKEAFRVRKAIGGGMRQVGVIAAAGLYALQNNIDRLKEDHANAKLLAGELARLDNIVINAADVETNILMFKSSTHSIEHLMEECKKRNLLIGPGGVDIIRLVTHMDISTEDVNSAVGILSKILAK